MPAPVTVDLATLSGLWAGFTISGCTGAAAGDVNGDWSLAPEPDDGDRYYLKVGGTSRVIAGDTACSIQDGADLALFSGDGAYPWEVESWVAESGTVGGTLAFAYFLPPPLSIEQDGAEATVQATLTTALTGTHNDLLFTAVPAGRLGNVIGLIYVNPGTNNAALSVSVSGFTITVNLATNGSAAITSTAAQVEAAIEASAAASALVTVANAPGNNGSGVVTAMTFQDLAGGEGGLPEPPQTVTI